MKSIQLFLVGLGCGLGAVAGCGDNDELICAPGTFHDGESCSAIDPNDSKPPVTVASPAAGRRRTPIDLVTIRSDEPAKIVYTTDGSEPDPKRTGEPSPAVIRLTEDTTTIKWIGVDAGGNVEAVHSETWIRDAVGPGPVTNLSLNTTGTTATLTWTNPTDADYAGTLVVRTLDLVDSSPETGNVYAPGDSLSPSMLVAGAVAGTQLEDAGRSTGPLRYAVYTYDDLGNYGAPVFVEGAIGGFDSAATFTYDTGTQTLTPTVTPPSIDLTGTTADYAGTTLTIHLSVTNKTTNYFQNPKIEVTSVTNATFANADGTADTFPFATLGNEFFAPGSTRTADLTFTGAAAATTVTFQLALGHHASIYGSNGKLNRKGGPNARRFVDVGSGVDYLAIPTTLPGRNQRGQGLTRRGVLTGGRYLDLPTSHGLERIDMTTFTRVAGTLVSNSVFGLFPGPDHTLYAVTSLRSRNGDVTVVHLDEQLRTLQTASLGNRDGHQFGAASVSADGTLLAFPSTRNIVLFDLTTMTVKDADPTTTPIDPIVTNFNETARATAFFNGKSGVVAIQRSSRVAIAKLSASGVSVANVETGSKAHALLTAPDGRVWIASDNDLRVYNPTTDAVTVSSYPHGAHGLVLVDGNVWVLRNSLTSVDRIDDTGTIQQSLPIGATGYGHWIGLTK